MSGGNFDPCECVCNSQRAIQRLLSVLRTSQQHCTETECFSELPSNQGAPQDQQWIMMLASLIWIAVIIVLFLTRPASLRGQTKHSGGHNDHPNGRHPPPDQPPVQ